MDLSVNVTANRMALTWIIYLFIHLLYLFKQNFHLC